MLILNYELFYYHEKCHRQSQSGNGRETHRFHHINDKSVWQRHLWLVQLLEVGPHTRLRFTHIHILFCADRISLKKVYNRRESSEWSGG